MSKLLIEDLQLEGKRVLMRVDFERACAVLEGTSRPAAAPRLSSSRARSCRASFTSARSRVKRITVRPITNGGIASMKQIVSALAVVVIVACLTLLRSYGGDEVQDARVQKGKLWYEKYCTPCHGAGGTPGSAVFAATKKPIDLRTYVQRNGGRFPSARWWDLVFSSRPSGVHADVWERVHNDQSETDEVERDVAAHGVVANIEMYVMSIQNKNK
jgi:hypothetical protein